MPIYLFGRILSNIETDSLLLHASDIEESEEALTQLTLTNKGIHSGVALPFNLLGSDP